MSEASLTIKYSESGLRTFFIKCQCIAQKVGPFSIGAGPLLTQDSFSATFCLITVCKRNYWSPYGILLVELPLVAVLFISINNNINNEEFRTGWQSLLMSGQTMAHRYHSYYTISANPIYMDPDYNSPLSYCWGYCNLSIVPYYHEGISEMVAYLCYRDQSAVGEPWSCLESHQRSWGSCVSVIVRGSWCRGYTKSWLRYSTLLKLVLTLLGGGWVLLWD